MQEGKEIIRSFSPGSEWLYYKFYTGPKTADQLLTQLLRPLLADFEKEHELKKWFFIRYADPQHHLRVRLHIPKRAQFGPIVSKIHDDLQPWSNQGLVWKIQIDEYKRELERYGAANIEFSESIFYTDSNATLHFLDLIEGDEGEQLRWLFGLRSIDNFLDGFEYSLQKKLELLEGLKTAYGREFRMARPLKKQIDAKYREERTRISNFLAFTEKEEPDYLPLLVIWEQYKRELQPVTQQILKLRDQGMLQVYFDDLLGSYIHMMMNRLFKSKNRLNEMVCYDFLYRYYRSKSARKS